MGNERTKNSFPPPPCVAFPSLPLLPPPPATSVNYDAADPHLKSASFAPAKRERASEIEKKVVLYIGEALFPIPTLPTKISSDFFLDFDAREEEEEEEMP